jgi:probable rRNA maturation factor
MASLGLEFSLVAEAEPPEGLAEDRIEDLIRFVLAAEGATGDWEIAVALVADDRLQALHRDFMGIDSPTDIMTFPIDDEPGMAGRGGELVISADHALTEAASWGQTPAGEVEFLVAHGVLHLLGWRDETTAGRERMLARQTELIERWREGATGDDPGNDASS